MAADGVRVRTLSKQSVARARAWTSMRILRRFTLPDLVATAEIAAKNAGRYLSALIATGFVRIAQRGRSRTLGDHHIYHLIRDTGPHQPRVQNDGSVWDPNTAKVWRRNAQHQQERGAVAPGAEEGLRGE